MSTATDSVFGMIEYSAPGCWEGTRAYGGRVVSLDLSIKKAGLSATTLETALNRVDDLAELDRIGRQAIREDAAKEDSAAETYFDHHVDELDDAELLQLFSTAARDEIGAEVFFARLSLVRVGLYPEDEDAQILLDYSLEPEITNYVLCVSLDAKGSVRAVDIES